MLKYLFCLVFIATFSCSTRIPKKTNEGKLMAIEWSLYDSANNKFVDEGNLLFNNFWYKDSCTIEEVTGINYNIDSKGKYKQWLDTQFYRFVDLSSGTCYHYYNFSDTAKPFCKYHTTDTIPESKIGFMYYKEYPQQHFRDQYYYITDTVINKISFQRIVDTFSGYYENRFYHYREVGYIRCDKKDVIVEIDKPSNRKIGCPVVRIDYNVLNTKVGNCSRIDFLRDTLLDSEKKIFAAWQKNARENPLK